MLTEKTAKRLAGALNHLRNENEHERNAAAQIVGRIAAEANLDWEQILNKEVATRKFNAADAAPDPFFSEFFRDLRAAPSASPRQQQSRSAPDPRRRWFEIEHDIRTRPMQLAGRISVIDRRQTRRGGRMVVVGLKCDSADEPVILVAFGKVASMLDALPPHSLVLAQTEPPRDPKYQPQLMSVSPV